MQSLFGGFAVPESETGGFVMIARLPKVVVWKVVHRQGVIVASS